jgi:hypothetical protein
VFDLLTCHDAMTVAFILDSINVCDCRYRSRCPRRSAKRSRAPATASESKRGEGVSSGWAARRGMDCTVRGACCDAEAVCVGAIVRCYRESHDFMVAS